MSGNKDKSGEKKSTQTVQTLLAAKKGQSDKQKDKPPPAKRLISDVSMESNSDIDLLTIQSDLDTIKGNLKGVIKKSDLDKALSNIVRKGDIENIVTSIVTKLVDQMKKDIEHNLREKTNKQSEAIEKLSQENEDLREIISTQRRSIEDLRHKVDDNDRRSKEALMMGNYNEQYSRKFNIKIMHYPEKSKEDLRGEFVKNIVKDKLKVDIAPSEVQAIHRIPGKAGQPKPVIVKLINSDVKSKIMRQKKNLPREGVKLVDDVTKHNMGLITRLRDSGRLENVWYFNGSVFGKTSGDTKLKFDLFDDIESKLRGVR